MYNSTFSSTLSANTTTCQASGSYTTYRNTLISDGVAGGTATTIADDWCTRQARADAIRAAQNAADASASTKWITFDSYGTGARPKIQPGGSVKYAFHFDPANLFEAFKIKNIDLDDADVAGIFVERHAANVKSHGLWIENVRITNVTGVTIDGTGTYPGAEPNYIGLFALGIDTVLIDQVRIKDVEVTSSDAPISLFGADSAWISGGNFHDSFVNGLFLQGIGNATPLITGATYVTPIQNALIETTLISNMGSTTGYAKGVSGLLFANSRDFIVDNTEITLSKINVADGVAIDLEGNIGPDISSNVIPWIGIVQNSNLHANAGAAFLSNDSTSNGSNAASRMLFDNNLFTGNATSGGGAALPAIMGERTGLSNHDKIFTNCNVAKSASGAFLWGWDATHAYTPMTNSTPSGYTFGASNSVHFP